MSLFRLLGPKPHTPRAMGLFVETLIGGVPADLTVLWVGGMVTLNGANGVTSAPEVFSGALTPSGTGLFTVASDNGFLAVTTPASTTKDLRQGIPAGGCKTQMAVMRIIALPAAATAVAAWGSLNPQVTIVAGTSILANAGGVWDMWVDGVHTQALTPGIHACLGTANNAGGNCGWCGYVASGNTDYVGNILGGLCVNRVLNATQILNVSRAVLRHFRTVVV